jgi:hypothetical protein
MAAWSPLLAADPTPWYGAIEFWSSVATILGLIVGAVWALLRFDFRSQIRNLNQQRERLQRELREANDELKRLRNVRRSANDWPSSWPRRGTTPNHRQTDRTSEARASPARWKSQSRSDRDRREHS